MRILTLVRYQGLDLRRNLMQIFMPVMMLGMAGFFAILAHKGAMTGDSLGHAIGVAITVATLIPAAMLTAMSIGEEKERRTLEALLLTPVKPWELISARLLSASIMMIISLTLAVLMFWRPIASPGLLLLYLLLAGGWAIATALLVGVVADDMKGATGYIQMLVTVPFSLQGAPWEHVAPQVWSVLRFTPYRPSLELIRKGMMGGDGWLEPALVLAGWLVATILIALTQIRRRGFVR